MIRRLVLSALCVLSLSAAADAVNTNANEQLSDAFVRSAVSFMTFSQAIDSEDPLVLAGTLLDSAVELNPSNAQAWAMRAELAQTAGDQDAYEKALVGYLNTGVDDDRARFNLIQYRLASNNTLDAQLREVEKLLDSETGRALSGPLRSRLAMFACSVATELIDEKARRKWAVEAARADPANLQAAQTMLALVIELGGDDVRRGTAMVNVIRADPLSPGPRLELAALLAENAAFERAAQQYQVVSTRLSAQPLPLRAYINWAHCLAMSGQDTLLLQLLDEFESALNQAPAPAQDANAQPAAEPAAPPAEPVALPLGLEIIRLAVLRDNKETDQAQVVFDRIARQLRIKPDQGEDAVNTDQSREDLALIAAVFGPDLDQAEQIAKDSGSDPVAMGWIALRRGDANQARTLLQPHAQQQPLAACGLSLANGQDDAGRARLLQGYIESASTTSLAALAAGRAMLKTQVPAQPTTPGKALLALMAKSPEAFWLVDLDRTPWLDVRMKIKPARIKSLEPVTAELTIWNTSRFPLAISDNGPINQKAIITLNATSAGRLLPTMEPVVVDLGQRFTLNAGERIIIDTRIDYHQFGSLRASNPGIPLAFDARLLVNPVLNPAGLWRPGGIGALSDVRDCLIEARPASSDAMDRWISDLGSDVTSDKLLAMRRLASLDAQSRPDLVTQEVIDRITPQLISAYNNATPSEQAWIILSTIALAKETTTYPALLEQATQSKSQLVWLALLVSQATEADSSLLRTAIGRQDLPEVSRFAERQRRLLRAYKEFIDKQQAEQPAE